MDGYVTHGTYSYSYKVDSEFSRTQPTNSGKISDNGTQFFSANSTTGYRNPFWKSQIKLGQNATTNFVGVRYSGQGSFVTIVWDSIYRLQALNSNPAADVVWHYETSGLPSYSVGPSQAITPTDVRTRVRNRALRKFLDDCQSKLSSIEAGQDFGEYKETLHSIKNPLGSMRTKLVSYLESLTKAKRRVRNAKALAKVLADTYLEFRFGINPLVEDVANLIADAGRYRFPVYPVRGQASDLWAGSNTIVGMGSPGYCSIFNPSHNMKSNTTYMVRFKGAIRTNASFGQIGRAQSLRLLPSDWLPTAWDLLPWSWVADYFTNVGDIIQALSFPVSNLVWACETDRVVSTVEYSDVFLLKTNWLPQDYYWVKEPSFNSLGGSASFTYSDVNRSPVVGSGLIPQFEFSIPTGKYPYYNLAAVLITRAKKLVPFF